MAAPVGTPAVTVVIATAGVRTELLWALDALHDQRLAPGERMEVVVVHDDAAGIVLDAAADHPLMTSGPGRLVREPGRHGAARKRNVGWRAGSAPLVAFTDDDCRPRPDWVASLLAEHRRRPDALLQGGAAIDPDQLDVALHAPWTRVQSFVPPTPWAELCSLALPRDLLERLDGLDETYRRVGEDTDLAWRAREAGAPWIAVPDAVVDHAVEAPGLRGALATRSRFAETVRLVGRHPGLRRHLPLRTFWSPAHAWLGPALVGTAWAVGRRDPLPALLAAPYVAYHGVRYGRTPRGVARALLEIPGHVLVDGARSAAFAAASWRERRVLL
ncbi:MAG: glycosyltransferase [Solirubrobacteraceae bacterium]|nr:glycosyltransferase [Solirubrobacteraceae bacterium]